MQFINYIKFREQELKKKTKQKKTDTKYIEL